MPRVTLYGRDGCTQRSPTRSTGRWPRPARQREGPDGPHRTTGHASATGRTAGISRSPLDSETTFRQGAAPRRKGSGGDLDDDRRGRALRRGPDEAKIDALDDIVVRVMLDSRFVGWERSRYIGDPRVRRRDAPRLPARPAGHYWDGIDDHTGRNVVALPPEAQSIPTSPSRSSSLTGRSRAAARWSASQPIEPRPQWAAPPGV